MDVYVFFRVYLLIELFLLLGSFFYIFIFFKEASFLSCMTYFDGEYWDFGEFSGYYFDWGEGFFEGSDYF